MKRQNLYLIFNKILLHCKAYKLLSRFTNIYNYYPSRNVYNCCCIKQSEVSSRIIFLLRISSLSEKSDNEDCVYPDGKPMDEETEELDESEDEEGELCQGLVC